jgi:hypothetical protein
MSWSVRAVPWRWITPALVALLAVALCSWLSDGLGFPLDDAWIHQDFARTLATSGQFALQPGRSAAGETSPLWALLLTPPYLLAGDHPPLWLLVVWNDLLGSVTLAALSLVAGWAARLLATESGASARLVACSGLLASAAVLGEWHLIWASASGMETSAFALLGLLLLLGTARGWHPGWLGALASVTLGLRPEGGLLVLVLLGVLAWSARRGQTLHAWPRVWLLPFGLAFLPGLLVYSGFNILAGGSFVPTTFLAKSAEFLPTGNPFLTTLVWMPDTILFFFLSSPLLVLLTFLAALRRVLPGMPPRPKTLLWQLLWGWSLALLLAYTGRVGPGYHHSRYLLPALPPLLILAAASATPVLLAWRRLFTQFAFLTLLVVCPLSFGRAIVIYQNDVQAITCAEVETGRFLRDHTPEGALIATHDVGAIGYFSGHPLIDFTGLVDPELIPLLHNPDALESYFKAHHVAYVAIYQDWFPPTSSLMQDLHGTAVYSACGAGYFQIYQTGW